MKQILLKNIGDIITFNDNDDRYKEADILIRGAQIAETGKNIRLTDDKISDENTQIIDCTGLVALPGRGIFRRCLSR